MGKVYLTGLADEVSQYIEKQIDAIKMLGWRFLECRNVNGENITNIDDRNFDFICDKLDEANIKVSCFSSLIANWAKPLSQPADSSYEELRRAIPRMKRLGVRFIRVMSFAVAEDDSINSPQIFFEVIKRMKTLTNMAEDAEIVLLHENCNTWGGRSFEHTLRLLDNIQSSAFGLLFDTGNPVSRKDIRGKAPWAYQNSYEFYRKVREKILYVHIKDGRMRPNGMEYCYPGEGDAQIIKICQDLYNCGYNGPFSIEPHMGMVFHEGKEQIEEKRKFEIFIEYGKRIEHILKTIGYSLTLQ